MEHELTKLKTVEHFSKNQTIIPISETEIKN